MISLAGAASTTWLLSRWFRAINLDGSFWMNFFRYSFWKRFSISFFSWMHFLVAWLMFSWNLKKIPRVPSHYWCFNQMRSLRKVTFLFGLGWERTFEKRWAAWIHTLHQGSVSRHITSEDSIFSLIFSFLPSQHLCPCGVPIFEDHLGLLLVDSLEELIEWSCVLPSNKASQLNEENTINKCHQKIMGREIINL